MGDKKIAKHKIIEIYLIVICALLKESGKIKRRKRATQYSIAPPPPLYKQSAVQFTFPIYKKFFFKYGLFHNSLPFYNVLLLWENCKEF